MMLPLMVLVLLTGCAGFFVNEGTSTSTSTTTTNSGDYVYAANPTANTLSGYVVGTGTLTAVSSVPYTLVSGLAPVSVAVSGKNTFVYVAGNGAIYGYAIGTGGVLTTVSSGAALALANVTSLTASPDGNWLLGLDSLSQQVDEFQISLTTGLLTSLTPVAYTPAYTGTVVPKMVRFSPAGSLVVAALGTAGDAVFTFNTTSGLLTYTNSVVESGSTISDNAVAIDSNNLLYVATSGYSSGSTTANGVVVYTLTTAGGISTNRALVASGAGPASLVLDPAYTYLYTGNRTDQNISEYALSAGVLTALGGSPVAVGGIVSSMAFDNTGKYVLVGSYGGTTDLALYSSSSGVLTNVATALTGTDSTGLLVATTH